MRFPVFEIHQIAEAVFFCHPRIRLKILPVTGTAMGIRSQTQGLAAHFPEPPEDGRIQLRDIAPVVLVGFGIDFKSLPLRYEELEERLKIIAEIL